MTGRWNISIVVMIALFGLVIAGSGADGARLQGYVTDAVSEDGIGDIWIEAWNGTLEEDNSTWSEYGNGYYAMNLSMGDFSLEAEHYAYEKHYANITIDEMEEWYNFTMEPFARVKGYVTDNESEEGIYGVWLSFTNDTQYYFYASTNSTGYYETLMPRDDYEMWADHSEYLDTGANLTVGDYEFWYNFTMDPLAQIFGYVTDNDTGFGIPWAWLQMESDAYGHYYYTTTNDTGYYEAWLPMGLNFIWGSATNYTGRNVNITVSEMMMWFNFTLDPMPEPDVLVMGYVTNGTGAAIEGAGVWLSQYPGFSHYEDNDTDGDGFYTLGGFSDTSGSIEAWIEGYNENWTYVHVEGEVFWFNITLTRMMNITIKGYVTDENETALNDADVEFSGPDWEWNYTEEDGYYTFVVHAAGKYMVIANWEGLDFFGYVTVPETDVFWYNITLHEPQSGNGSMYNVEGYVYDLDTEDPIEGAMVFTWSDMDSNDTTTNATGWFAMTLWAMDWIDVKTKATGYYEEYEYFGAENIMENFWLEPANATKYHVKGYVYDDETDKTIVGAKVEADSDADYNWTTTNATGWFYMEIMAEDRIDVEVGADGYFKEWEDFDAENIHEDFYLDPIPDNGTVTGIIVNETGDPIEGVMVEFMMMFGDDGDDGYDDFITSDENGSYEIHGPAVLVALVVMDRNMTYFPYVHAVAIVEDKVIWHNITLYAFKENDTIVEGYVKDSEGDAVNDAEVILYPAIPGAMMLQYRAYTDGDGRYEMGVPNGSYIAVVMADEIEEWYIEYLDVDGDTWYNVSLVAVINETSMEIHFETWEGGTAKMVQKMSGMSEMFSRLFIDMVFGDSDGTVSAEENDIFVDLFTEEFGMDPEFDDEDSKDDYTVDDIGYIMEFSSVHIYAKGDVVSFAAIEIKMMMELEVNGTIEEADTHEIAMNITGDDADNPFRDFTFYIPTGFWLENFTAPDGVTVTGVSVLEIEANDTAEGWLYMTVTSVGAPDPVVLDDPENIEGTSMDLSWSEFDGTDFQMYKIYRSTKMDSIGHPVADITYVGETVHTVTGLSPGVTYYFVVRTYITTGTYADSNQVSDSTPTTSSPGFDVIVSITYTPEKPAEDKTVTVSAVISNEMDESVTLSVLFLVDGVEKGTENLTLASGASDTLTFTWKAKKGTHNITVRAESGVEWSIDMEDVYVKGGSSSTPGFEVLVVTAALVVAVAVRRRRH